MHFQGIQTGVVFLLILQWLSAVRRGRVPLPGRSWPLFLFAGFVFLFASVLISTVLLSALLAILGIACFWSIGELIEKENGNRK